jgi:hypothetical protein
MTRDVISYIQIWYALASVERKQYLQFGPKAHRPVNQWCAYQRICTSETLKFKRLLRMTQEVRLAIYKTALLLVEESTVAILLQSLSDAAESVRTKSRPLSVLHACLLLCAVQPWYCRGTLQKCTNSRKSGRAAMHTSLTSVSRISLQRRPAFRPSTCILSYDMRSATRPVLTR